MQRSLFVGVSAIALLAGWAPHAQAQQKTENIIVTGTRQGNRAAESSPVPVDVLPGDILQHTGQPLIEDVLNDVLPSYTMPVGGGGDMSGLVRPASMRGLQPDQMLVLVNGKRRHVTSIVGVSGTLGNGSEPVDINMIPTSMIDHIEVLRDGASAQYGSDAIAGVINIILKNADHGGTLTAGGGAYFAGDGINENASADVGMKLGSDGFLHLSASGMLQHQTNRAKFGTLRNYFVGDPRNVPLPGVPGGFVDGLLNHSYGIPKNDLGVLGFNAAKPLGDFATVYASGTYGHHDTNEWVGYRTAYNDNTIRAFYPNGFQPQEAITGDDYALTGGIKGPDILGWAWDLSENWGRNIERVHVFNSDNPTMGLASPTDFSNGSWITSEFSTNLDLTRSFDVSFLPAPLDVAAGAEERFDNYRILRGEPAAYINGGVPILDGPNKGLFIDAPGAQSFNGFLPSQQSDNWRNSTAGYVDLETKPTPEWQAGVAGRVESFSDFGTALIGKISSRYDFTPQFAIRGAVNNGFRAPNLGEINYATSTTNFITGNPIGYNQVNVPVTSAAAKALGAKPLQPETSINLSLGFVFKPVKDLTASIDGYQIEISNRIVETGNIGLVSPGQTVSYKGKNYGGNALNPAVGDLLRSLGIQGVDAARYFLNGLTTRTRGLDVVVAYKTDFGDYGLVDWNLGANLNTQKVTHLNAITQSVVFGTQIFNKLAIEQLLLSTPKSKINFTANYTIDRYSLMIRETRYGQAVAMSTLGTGFIYAPDKPRFLTDIEGAVDVTDKIRFTLGAQNVFDVHPTRNDPRNIPPSSFNGGALYAGSSPFGFSGGLYYTKLSYVW